MHPFRLVVLGGTAFAVAAMLLPFASFPVVGPVDGIGADAWPALIPLILVTLLALTGRWNRSWGAGAAVFGTTAALASLIFTMVKVADAVMAARSTEGATFGPGSVVLGMAVTVATAGAVYGTFSRT